MLRISESTVIERPPAEVFEVAADPHEQLKWDPETLKSVEKLTPGPLVRGSRYRGEFKGFGTVEYEFERGRRFTHHTVVNLAEIRHIFEFEEVPEGIRLTQSIEAEPRGVGKVIALIMRMMFRRRLRAINSELSRYLGHASHR